MQDLDFSYEIKEAVKNYDRYVVCLKKTPDEFKSSVQELVAKATEQFKNRPAGTRSSTVFDKWVTVVVSERDEKIVCGIYLNLCSPNVKKNIKPLGEKIED